MILLARDKSGLLLKRMEEAVDGDYQKYVVEPGSYVRNISSADILSCSNSLQHLTDEQFYKLMRGGHDTRKVYATYKAAMEHKGQPTVILAKTVKGYGLGEAGEGRNISHQQKKDERRNFASSARFNIPMNDDVIADMPFYRPPVDSPESGICSNGARRSGVFCRRVIPRLPKLDVPKLEFFRNSSKARTPAKRPPRWRLCVLLTVLLRHKGLPKNIVPIIPDEARTFGMDSLFREIGIYSSKGQLYEPVDKNPCSTITRPRTVRFSKKASPGGRDVVVHRGGHELCHPASRPFRSTPYYSMFGPQRIGDLVWLAGDIKDQGFPLRRDVGSHFAQRRRFATPGWPQLAAHEHRADDDGL